MAALALTACTSTTPGDTRTRDDARVPVVDDAVATPARGEVTLAFAGDVHFEAHVGTLLRRGLGPIARTLRSADVAMVNLETPVTERGRRDPKELEFASDRYYFRTPPRALGALADAGVDVVTVANNHAGDYGEVGLSDTIRAARRSRVAVVGAGRNSVEAFTPHVVRKDDLDVAFLAADTVQREGGSGVWSAGPRNAGIAAARGSRTDLLLDAVETAATQQDLVVVYVHWGRENEACPTQSQRRLGRELADAGADVVVGSHSHVLGGAGWSGDTYVSYGLGNFVWYHSRQPDTGVLTLRLDADGVVEEDWVPARIAPDGRPLPVTGPARAGAVRDWRAGARCSGLAAERGEAQADDPEYDATIAPIDAALAERMRGSSHRRGCPVPLSDLRHLTMTYRGFGGLARTGEMVVHRRFARDVTQVFGRLYDVGYPIARMRLVDEYGGDDDASMADNNTSGFNCRRVAGQRNWSDHAFGAAIDVNPVQNPYVRPGSIDPPAGRRYAAIDRGRSAPVPVGVIREGDLLVREFARIGWQWGGYWVSSKDYQHVAAARPPAA
ncbi:poly-gamma-glutamate synthesis protein (capsule biosynthesis protein) [Nocardioides alpinus]|uniref:Poly-gamma-glutamate synthesis protein (Capsule biosynthesis protein) n=1 Tax=Nocardioides alpinus TaxID=748909 RepID=A0A1I0VNP3_9ACTN|nr:poly-gamma-glutamate synthesis protein (capsule biosynthesis protein) [Nocardioides alpinus]